MHKLYKLYHPSWVTVIIVRKIVKYMLNPSTNKGSILIFSVKLVCVRTAKKKKKEGGKANNY